jgi:putative SOS response-associated peptidase YedK
LLEQYHNRTPVILKPGEYERWLAYDRVPVDILSPDDSESMTAMCIDPGTAVSVIYQVEGGCFLPDWCRRNSRRHPSPTSAGLFPARNAGHYGDRFARIVFRRKGRRSE